MKKVMNFSTIYKYFATSKPHIFYTMQTKHQLLQHIAILFRKPYQNNDKKTKKATQKRAAFLK